MSNDDADEVIPGTNLSRGELRSRMQAADLRRRQDLAKAYVAARGRSQTPRTRRRISAKVAAYQRAKALESDAPLHPLRRARLDAELTQVALAEKALVDHTTVQTIESGQHEPSRLTLLRLARALGAEPEAIT